MKSLRHFIVIAGSSLLALPFSSAQSTVYWDGTPGTPDGASNGGGGTWSTGDANWDNGSTYEVWNNASGDTAVFGGTADTVTVSGAIDLQTLSLTNLSTTNKYTIDGGTLNFASGGTITTASTNSSNFVDFAFITSAITGAPNIVHGFSGANNQLVFAPASGSVALGTVGGSGITRLAGNTTGNSLVGVSNNNCKLKVSSGTWELTGTASAYEHFIEGGNLVISTGSLQHTNRATRLSGGTLHYNNPAAVKDSNTGSGGDNDFRFMGGSLDNTSGAAITTSTYNPGMTWEADWTFIGSNGANSDLYLGSGLVVIVGATRQVTVQNAATTLTYGGIVTDGSGLFGVTKAGPGTLKLQGSNSYSGPTTVSAGTLSLGDGTNNSNLADFSTVSVETGAKLDLNFDSGNPDTVLFLNLGGSPAAVGTWGSTSSTATNQNDTYFSGTGVINNLGGAGVAFWDGGVSNIGTDGNGDGEGTDGTWDTTIENWDVGPTAHAAWPNTTSSKAHFRRYATGNHTVTLGSDITLGELDYRGTFNTNNTFFIGEAAEDNTLNFGGTKTITTKNYYVNIRSGIAGAPTINYEARSADNSSKLTLAPAGSLTMTLGAINMQKSTGTVNNCILELGGSSTGNSASSVTWSNVAQQLALNKVGAGTWTLSGGWDNAPMGDSQWKVQGGTLILDGNFNISHRLDVESGGTLKGNATLRVERTGATEHVRVLAGGTMAPGTSIGTINVNDKTTIAGTLEIEVNGATADLLAITGDLDLSAATDALTVVELGAATLADYTVITYTGTRTGTFDTTNLPPGYSVDYGTPGEIHLSVGGGGSDYSTWASTNGISGQPFDGDFDNDGISNGMEYGLGLSPTASSQPPGVLSGNTITFTKGADAITNGDVDWIIETSTSLAPNSWMDEAAVEVGNTISFTFTPGTPAKKFARLKVVQVP